MSLPVSIVLVTYNRAERLKIAIQDILAQSSQDFELIICDDCSPDNTSDICNNFAAQDQRIRYIRNKTNLGMPGNLNYGISLAKYDYILILHDDNRYDKDMVSLCRKVLEDYRDVAFIFYPMQVIDKNENVVRVYRESFCGVINGKYLLRKVFFRRCFFDSPVFGVSACKKSAINEQGLFNPDYGFYSDVDMWMALLHKHNAFYIDKFLVKSFLREYSPHQFNDNVWQVKVMIHRMFLKHILIEFFRANRTVKFLEITNHYFYRYLDFGYNLLIVLKNNTSADVKAAWPFIKKETPLLIGFWVAVLILKRIDEFCRKIFK